MSLWLGPDIFAVMIDGDAVFLDVGANAYFCLPDVADALRLEGRSVLAPHPALAHELIQAGLACRRSPESAPAAPPPSARLSARALLAAEAGLARRIGLRHGRALLAAGLAARAAMRRPFAAMLPIPRDARAPAPDARMLGDLSVFRRLWPWTPFDGRCLFRSHFLRGYLRRLGHQVDWVFGVRTWPFEAHCWLQAGDVALEDEAERLVAFHPIMVR